MKPLYQLIRDETKGHDFKENIEIYPDGSVDYSFSRKACPEKYKTLMQVALVDSDWSIEAHGVAAKINVSAYELPALMAYARAYNKVVSLLNQEGDGFLKDEAELSELIHLESHEINTDGHKYKAGPDPESLVDILKKDGFNKKGPAFFKFFRQ